MQKDVKIIGFKVSNFGIFKALEFDFEQFKSGVIAIKGKSGEGKSTFQKGIKLTTQGRESLADSEQYGENWVGEVQLLDGERKIFIEATKKKGNTPNFKLFEKDSEGKKVMTPIIDGVKATPAKYLEVIATEMTFGIKSFLSESNTVHNKFMFELFKDELKKLGVIFDKKNAGYSTSIMGELDTLTGQRDLLRSQCQAIGAYDKAFEREGYKLEQLGNMTVTNIQELESEKGDLLIKKGAAEGSAETELLKKQNAIKEKGAVLVNECREITERFDKKHQIDEDGYVKHIGAMDIEYGIMTTIIKDMGRCSFIYQDNASIFGMKRNYSTFVEALKTAYNDKFPSEPKRPTKPTCPEIKNGQITFVAGVSYEPEYNGIITSRNALGAEYMSLTTGGVDSDDTKKAVEGIESQITAIDGKISIGRTNNALVERYDTNREWIEACEEVKLKREELSKLYAKVNTGVDGLYMKPFYNEEGKMEIKTVYTGNFAPEYFHNDDSEERLLVSYSSTQKPIIGILLQVSRLKLKAKALKYIFLDDVPMDKTSYGIIARIAEENGLTILTSITGDFTKENLQDNEMLIEGGEVFFN